jgi:hypothetical protein
VFIHSQTGEHSQLKVFPKLIRSSKKVKEQPVSTFEHVGHENVVVFGTEYFGILAAMCAPENRFGYMNKLQGYEWVKTTIRFLE